jgi:hypothetical protein
MVGQLADAPADTPLSRLSQVCGWNEILWETPEVTTAAMVGQLADAPADTPLSRLSHSSSSSHRGHAYAGITRLSHSFSSPTGMWLEWNPVGDAGGHDGTGRGRTTGGSVSTCASRHTAFAAVAQLQQLPQGHAYAGITRLSHSFSSPTGMWLEWNPVGDAGGHDGSDGGSDSRCAS